MTAGRICCRCQQPIAGPADRIQRDSMSGARPDDWRHRTVAACKAALAGAKAGAS